LESSNRLCVQKACFTHFLVFSYLYYSLTASIVSCIVSFILNLVHHLTWTLSRKVKKTLSQRKKSTSMITQFHPMARFIYLSLYRSFTAWVYHIAKRRICFLLSTLSIGCVCLLTRPWQYLSLHNHEYVYFILSYTYQKSHWKYIIHTVIYKPCKPRNIKTGMKWYSKN